MTHSRNVRATLLALLTIFALTVATKAYGDGEIKHMILVKGNQLTCPVGEKGLSEWIDEHLFRPKDAQGKLIEGYVDVKVTFEKKERIVEKTNKKKYKVTLRMRVADQQVVYSTDERLNFDALVAVRSMSWWKCHDPNLTTTTATLRIVFDKTTNLMLNGDTTVYDRNSVSRKPICTVENGKAKNYVIKAIGELDFVKEKGYVGHHNVSFIVEADGRISNVHSECLDNPTVTTKLVDQTIMSALKSMPRWYPAQKKGKFVRCKSTFSSQFNVTDEKGNYTIAKESATENELYGGLREIHRTDYF